MGTNTSVIYNYSLWLTHDSVAGFTAPQFYHITLLRNNEWSRFCLPDPEFYSSNQKGSAPCFPRSTIFHSTTVYAYLHFKVDSFLFRFVTKCFFLSPKPPKNGIILHFYFYFTHLRYSWPNLTCMVAFKGTEVKFHIRWDVKITGILTFNLYLSYS